MRTAKAKAAPKPPPGSADSIRRQTEELKSVTALLQASNAVEHDPAEQDDFARMQAFSRAYGRWLKARAVIKGDEFPEEEREVQAALAEERAALRELFCLPALYSEDLWRKFEALETEL